MTAKRKPAPRRRSGPITLRELQADFVKRTPKGFRVTTRDKADGLWYLCPRCYVDNGYTDVGTHHVLNWWAHRVPDDESPGPGRWTPIGRSLDTLSYVPGSPPQSTSVLLRGGCNAHFFIEHGEIRFT